MSSSARNRNKIARSPDASVLKVRTENSANGVWKTIIVVLLVLLQIALLSVLYSYLIDAFRWYVLISLILSVCAAISIFSSRRAPMSKAVWVFLILVLFVVGFILCALSDERVFFGKSKRKYKKVFAEAENYIPQGDCAKDLRVKEDCAYLKSSGNFPSFQGTKIKYFSSGGLLFDDVLARLEEAESFIFIEYFIVADGVLLNRFLSVLSKKVKEGVDVRLIYDDMGSHSVLSHKAKKRVVACGIKLEAFNRLIPVFNIGLNYRDHRKIVVIDGKTAYTGGANLADEYTNEARMYGYWKDEGIRLDGKAVDMFTLIFLRQWAYLTGDKINYGDFLNRYELFENATVAVPYASGLDFDCAVGKEMYLNIIAKSGERLYIMTPYLVPDESIMNMLINKARSGVDVRIILPGIPDKAFVYKVTLGNAQALENSGVKIYRMKDSFVHSKIMLADYCAVVGSINMDMRSFYQQFESALYTDDKSVMEDIKKDFEKTFTLCEVGLKKGNIFNAMLLGVLKVVSPLM